MNKLIQHAGDMRRVAGVNGAAHPLGYYVAQIAGRKLSDDEAIIIESMDNEHEINVMLNACRIMRGM